LSHKDIEIDGIIANAMQTLRREALV